GGVDLVAARREHVPARAEALDALAVGVALVAIAGVEVERVPVIGDLPAAVLALRDPELGGASAAAGRGRGAGRDRGPHRRAGAGAARCRALVRLEQVHRTLLGARRQDRAELVRLAGDGARATPSRRGARARGR